VKAAAYKIFAEITGEGVEALGGPSTRPGARVAQMRDFYEFLYNEVPILLEKWQASKGER
jgi:hypothetical protein